MDEKERLRRRKEALLNSRRRGSRWQENESGAKEIFLYRAYVTMIIVGLTVVLSFFPTASAQKITGNLKQAIAYQVSLDSMQQAWQKTTTVLKRLDSSISQMKTKKTKTNQEDASSQEAAKETDDGAVPANSGFGPDLPDEDGP